jgi:hypothetical protein
LGAEDRELTLNNKVELHLKVKVTRGECSGKSNIGIDLNNCLTAALTLAPWAAQLLIQWILFVISIAQGAKVSVTY